MSGTGQPYTKDQPKIADRCPTCGAQSLFIGAGGFLTCGVIGCKNPAVGEAMESAKATLAARDADLAALRTALAEARSFGEMAAKAHNDLLMCRVTACVYCGHEYEGDTPTNDELTAHISVCEKHPMASLRLRYREAEDRIAALEEALYPLVVGCYEADAREDAPEFVNGEGYNGARALPQCERCDTTGATDKKHYEDMPIPSEVVCPDCGGWGFLKHPIALKEGQS